MIKNTATPKMLPIYNIIRNKKKIKAHTYSVDALFILEHKI